MRYTAVSMTSARIHGTATPAFAPLRRVFEESFAAGEEIGAAICVYVDGECVASLWGGVADRDAGRPWREDTMATVFSVTKGLGALCMLMLADQGELQHDRRVADYWPEFACHGKEDISVRQLLEHTSGLAAIDTPLHLYDFDSNPEKVTRALLAQRPLWKPGSKQGYGAQAWGPYVSELFYRITGQSIGRFFREHIAEPLGADVHIGLPAELDHRVAQLYGTSFVSRLLHTLPHIVLRNSNEGRAGRRALCKDTATHRAFVNPHGHDRSLDIYNEARVRRMELLWSGGLGSARGLARIYAPLALGGRDDGATLLRSPTSLEPVRAPKPPAFDEVVRKPMTWSLGFLKEPVGVFSPNPEAFGHAGMGGALTLADPTHRMAFAYVHNNLDYHVRSPRALRLCEALYRCLGQQMPRPAAS